MSAWTAIVDGAAAHADVPENASLAEALRASGALSVKVPCAEGMCGGCSVLLGEQRVHSCLVPAFRAQGATIRTAASFADGPVARALAEHGGLQCGFCTPGVVVAVHALPADVPATVEALRTALSGNLCRCTGYSQLIEGAAAGLRELRK